MDAKMEKFLNVLALNCVFEGGFEKNEPQAEFIDNLEYIMSPDAYRAFDEQFTNYKSYLCQYAALQGMKMAIRIMNDTYVAEG